MNQRELEAALSQTGLTEVLVDLVEAVGKIHTDYLIISREACEAQVLALRDIAQELKALNARLDTMPIMRVKQVVRMPMFPGPGFDSVG